MTIFQTINIQSLQLQEKGYHSSSSDPKPIYQIQDYIITDTLHYLHEIIKENEILTISNKKLVKHNNTSLFILKLSFSRIFLKIQNSILIKHYVLSFNEKTLFYQQHPASKHTFDIFLNLFLKIINHKQFSSFEMTIKKTY